VNVFILCMTNWCVYFAELVLYAKRSDVDCLYSKRRILAY